MKTKIYQKLPLDLNIYVEGKYIKKVEIKEAPSFSCHILPTNNDIKDCIEHWLEDYLDRKNSQISLPFALNRFTSFQQNVLREIYAIPFGEIATYGEIAAKVGNPGAARAVGTVCCINPFPFFIPCHRVVRRSGVIGNYAFGSAMKKMLLDFERTPVSI